LPGRRTPGERRLLRPASWPTSGPPVQVPAVEERLGEVGTEQIYIRQVDTPHVRTGQVRLRQIDVLAVSIVIQVAAAEDRQRRLQEQQYEAPAGGPANRIDSDAGGAVAGLVWWRDPGRVRSARRAEPTRHLVCLAITDSPFGLCLRTSGAFGRSPS
jgi:hypothetical protein